MKLPFSAESIVSDNLNGPVARSRAVLSLAPGRDTGVQGRDVGVQTFGGIQGRSGPVVEYSVGVFRGQTFVSAPKNHYNATAGRMIVHPMHGVSLGADWYGSFTAPARLEKRREEIEGEYDRGRLQIPRVDLPYEILRARDPIMFEQPAGQRCGAPAPVRLAHRGAQRLSTEPVPAALIGQHMAPAAGSRGSSPVVAAVRNRSRT